MILCRVLEVIYSVSLPQIPPIFGSMGGMLYFLFYIKKSLFHDDEYNQTYG